MPIRCVIHPKLKNHRCTGPSMKKVIWLLTILFVGFSYSATQAISAGDHKPAPKEDSEGIQFTDAAWKDILKKAKAEKKVIFLDAYASWCGPCKLLQKNVFTKKAVGEVYNTKFINVKMDMEKGEGPALSQVYPLEAYPTLLFIDSNGKILKKVIGLQTPENLIAIGKSVK
jgi:thioredoxin 1